MICRLLRSGKAGVDRAWRSKHEQRILRPSIGEQGNNTVALMLPNPKPELSIGKRTGLLATNPSELPALTRTPQLAPQSVFFPRANNHIYTY